MERERETSLSVEELYENARTKGYPEDGCCCCRRECADYGCFYVNELEIAFNSGSEEDVNGAKEALIALLSVEAKEVAALSFRALLDKISRDDVDMDLVRTVAEFQNDPENAEVVALLISYSEEE
jgi:hypothetical protein